MSGHDLIGQFALVAEHLRDTASCPRPVGRRTAPDSPAGGAQLSWLRTGALPRPLAVAVLTSAGVDALAPVVLAVSRAVLVIPAGRFPTFVVLGITGVRLARGCGRS